MGKNNKSIKDTMIKKYGRKCFIEELGLRTREEIEQDLKKFKKSKHKELCMLTFHHIKERRYGGSATEENGAILRNINHIWFNSLSREEQARINKLFQEYKLKFRDSDDFKKSLKVDLGFKRTTPEVNRKKSNNLKIKISTQELVLPVYDVEVDSEEYKKYIEARRKRVRESDKWKGRTWGIEDR